MDTCNDVYMCTYACIWHTDVSGFKGKVDIGCSLNICHFSELFIQQKKEEKKRLMLTRLCGAFLFVFNYGWEGTLWDVGSGVGELFVHAASNLGRYSCLVKPDWSPHILILPFTGLEGTLIFLGRSMQQHARLANTSLPHYLYPNQSNLLDDLKAGFALTGNFTS